MEASIRDRKMDGIDSFLRPSLQKIRLYDAYVGAKKKKNKLATIQMNAALRIASMNT
jgi:hypothetical protein